MNDYGKMNRSLRRLTIKPLSDQEPGTVQDHGTRKEMKDHEDLIKKGKLQTWIAIWIALLTLIIIFSFWPTIHR